VFTDAHRWGVGGEEGHIKYALKTIEKSFDKINSIKHNLRYFFHNP
jgi:hypothetical protein